MSFSNIILHQGVSKYSSYATSWTTRLRSPSEVGIFFASPPRPYRIWGPPRFRGALSPGVKRPGREADHTYPSSTEDGKVWSYASTLPYVFMTWYLVKHRDSSVGTALGYGLDDRGSRVRFPAGAGNFSPHHRVQNGFGAHPASYSMGTRSSFPGCKAAGAWSWPLTSIYCRGQRMSGDIPPLPQYAFMAWCSVSKKHRDNFTTHGQQESVRMVKVHFKHKWALIW
jgi:hypothetical protein